jgi:hypothetical protein
MLSKKKPLISNAASEKLERRTEGYMKGIICSEFTRSKRIETLTAYVIDSPCQYDLILGRDFLEDTGMMMNFRVKKVAWEKCQ